MKTSQPLQIALFISLVFALLGLSLWVMSPFLIAIVWATMLCVALWPVLMRLEKKLWNSRALATLVLMVGILLALVLPVSMMIGSIAEQAQKLPTLVRALSSQGLPALPDWISRLPFVGDRLAQIWQEFSAAGASSLMGKVTPHSAEIGDWLIAKLGNLSGLLLEILIILVVTAIFFMIGDKAAAWLQSVGIKLAGERGQSSIVLATNAIRAIAVGVGVTALVQASLSGFALAFAGVPMASLLTILMFVLCIAQVGAIPVLVPASIWLFWRGDTGWGIFIIITAIGVIVLDNVLRPLLIRRSVNLPALLIFAGVLGGLLTFGLLGIFLGPVIWAVTWTLIQSWLNTPATTASTSSSQEPPASAPN